METPVALLSDQAPDQASEGPEVAVCLEVAARVCQTWAEQLLLWVLSQTAKPFSKEAGPQQQKSSPEESRAFEAGLEPANPA